MTLGWHLGQTRHIDLRAVGYDEAVEDRLLDEIDWTRRRLSPVRGEHARRLVGARAVGPDRREQRPVHAEGDVARARRARRVLRVAGRRPFQSRSVPRACELPGVQLIVLLGEGTFHQIHGGIATSGRMGCEHARRVRRRYAGVRTDRPRTIACPVGTFRRALAHVEYSVEWALANRRQVT